MTYRYFVPESPLDDASEAPSAASPVISSLRVERRGGHEHVDVYNRGALAGTLVFELGDAERFAAILGFVETRVSRE